MSSNGRYLSGTCESLMNSTLVISTARAFSRRQFFAGAGIAALAAAAGCDDARPLPRCESVGAATPGGSRGGCLASAITWACCRTVLSRQTSGRDYATVALPGNACRSIANDFTVFSGVSHPDVDGGHPADNCFLTAAPHPGQRRFPQHNFARSVYRRAHRAPDAVPVADARRECAARAAQPFVDRFAAC